MLVQDLLVAKRDLKLSRFFKRLAYFEGLDQRRPGLRATEPGRDGSTVQPAGRALRARQRDDLQ
jgi:hypothetical protein